jgi:hypothetical protein
MKTEEQIESSAQSNEVVDERKQLRKWCFEKAMQLKTSSDIVALLIHEAAEIESYITEGQNLRETFYCDVEAALSQVDDRAVPEVSESSKRKTMVVVRKYLQEYNALGE